MKRMVVVCSVVTLLTACGGGGPGSDTGTDTGSDVGTNASDDASNDASELETEKFVNDVIEQVSAGKILPTDEDLSGVWFSVAGNSLTRERDCNDGDTTYDGRYVEVLHVVDNGDTLKVSYCDSGYSWEMKRDGSQGISKNLLETVFQGTLTNNNVITFPRTHYEYEQFHECVTEYEGDYTETMIKLSNDIDLKVGTLEVLEGDVDITCAFYELETTTDDEENINIHAILGVDDEDGTSYHYHLDKGALHLDVDDIEGEITMDGKVVTVSPIGGNPTQFVFD